MLIYFIKTIVLSGIFYLLYSLFLKDQKSFRWNRFYLLLTSFASIVIPMISFSALQRTPVAQSLNTNTLYTGTLETITSYGNAIQHRELDYAKMMLMLLLAGTLWGLVRIAFGLYIVYKLKQNPSSEKAGETDVYFHTQIDTPFSFFRSIFIPETFRHKEVLPFMLKHEEAHIALHHSHDKFYFALLQAFCWFNPFVYLYHKQLELQHEFEADAYSVQQIETDHYVKNLLENITYNQTPTLLVHQFFHHPLKTRITMLYKKSKNVFMQKTLALCGSILLLSVTLFVQSQAQTKKKQNSTPDQVTIMNPDHPEQSMTVKLSKTADSLLDEKTVDAMPRFKGGEEAMNAYINQHKGHFPDDIKPKKPVQVQLVISSNGLVASVGADPFIDKAVQKEIAQLFKGMPAWKPGLKNGKPVPVLTYVNLTY
ncbi:hypothetical protein EMGBS15_14960 [Filimonas sp.]|nr:hypothetical protein EMGBS15_14960 [Filimonas sp.]